MRVWLAVTLLVFCVACEKVLPLAGRVGTKATKVPAWERPQSLENAGTDTSTVPCVVDALNPEYRSDTTAQAFCRLATTESSDGIYVMIGHGAPGIICAGRGWDCGGYDEAALNEERTETWPEAEIKKLADLRPKMVRLAGCNVGVGDSGKRLLRELSSRLHCPVSAPKHAIYCSDKVMTEIKDIAWEVIDSSHASTTAPQTRKPNGTSKLAGGASPLSAYSALLDNVEIPVRWDKVTIPTFRIRRSYGSSSFIDADAAFAKAFVQRVDFSRSFNLGVPLAIPTAHFAIKIGVPGFWQTDSYVVYNDYLVQSEADPHRFYFADDHLPEDVQSWRASLR